MKKINPISLLISALLSVSPLFVNAASDQNPKLLLAKVYKKSSDLSHYWASEKYDGVRAYWDGQQFISRQGNIYHAPDWFTQNFPKRPLDGELWLARNSFGQLLSTVTKDTPLDEEWQQLSYRVFELPEVSGTFALKLVPGLVMPSGNTRLRLGQW